MPPPLPELAEPDVIRHFTNLSTKNMSVDTHFYPLGSCTMKYNSKRNERMAALGLHGTEAIVVGLLLTNAIKVGAGRQRPYVNRDKPYNFGFMRGWKQEQYRSFPSGHTLIAFAAAAAVTEETSRWWRHSGWYVGSAMYGGATLVALSRMYNNRHWASDVMIGGLIGTFAGLKVVKYHHTHPDNRVDRWLLGVVATPAEPSGWLLRPLVMRRR